MSVLTLNLYYFKWPVIKMEAKVQRRIDRRNIFINLLSTVFLIQLSVEISTLTLYLGWLIQVTYVSVSCCSKHG